ncbi:MAG: asparaginase [Gammaproteobacteria bacterium]|nr:asparaginase [Gammaproteobacteria bacterium]
MSTPNSSNATLLLLITGGTLDKEYQATTGMLVFPETHLPKLLNEANSTLPIQQTVLMQKDSLEMTAEDRHDIFQACLSSQQDAIVITHGTDTMVKTATFLQQQPGLADKRIVLTGAMRPYMLGHSDAGFNLGSAFMAAQLAKPGTYIAMNGQLFEAGNVQKNRVLGQFFTQ